MLTRPTHKRGTSTLSWTQGLASGAGPDDRPDHTRLVVRLPSDHRAVVTDRVGDVGQLARLVRGDLGQRHRTGVRPEHGPTLRADADLPPVPVHAVGCPVEVPELLHLTGAQVPPHGRGPDPAGHPAVADVVDGRG